MALAKALIASGREYYFGSQSFPDIAELRNIFLSLWFDRIGASHILFVDADMDFEPRLVLDMLDFNKPLVGCLYPKRTLPIEFVGRPMKGIPNTDGQFLEMEGIGFGVTLIRRDCVQAMIDSGSVASDYRLDTHVSGPMLKEQGMTRIIRAFDKIETETGTMSEDISFCHRYRDSGGQVWAATGHKITHVGQYGFSGQYVSIESPADYLRTKDCRHGRFTFNKNDSFIGASLDEYGEWCEYELQLLLPLLSEGDVVIDVGANIGTHAIPFAKATGRSGAVYAFEPQPALFEILQRNVAANIASGISLMRELVVGPTSEKIFKGGEATLADLPNPRTHFNFGALPAIGNGSNRAPVVRIDELNLASCRLIKIDVEGMEAQVIRGALQTIERHQPILYIENNGDDSAVIAPVLEEIGYRAFWSLGPYFNPDNYRGNSVNIWPNVMPSANLIAVHKDSNEALDNLFAHLLEFMGADDSWRLAAARSKQRAA